MIIFLTNFIFPFVLIGWGSLFSRILLKKNCSSITVWQSAAVGFAVLALLASGLNFFTPINDFISDLFWIAGLLLCGTVARKTLAGFFKNSRLLAIFLFLTFVLSILTRVDEHIYDSGFYMHDIFWLKLSKPLIGSVQLHTNFGVNSMWFADCAIAWNSLTGIGGAFALNTVLVVVFLMFLIEWLPFDELWERQTVTRFDLFSAFVLVFFLLPQGWGTGRIVLLETLGSPSTDAPSTLFAILGVMVLLRHQWDRSQDFVANCFMAFTFCAFAVSVKMTTALVALCPLFWLGIHRKSFLKSNMILPAIFLTVYVAVFMGRGLLGSGCLLYPNLCVQGLEWTPSPEWLKALERGARAYAIMFDAPADETLANWSWFPVWFVRLLKNPLVRTLFYMIGFGLLLMAFPKQLGRGLISLAKGLNLFPRDGVERSKNVIWKTTSLEIFMVFIAAMGIAIWFLRNPEFRYAYSYWIVFALMIFFIGLYRSGLHAVFAHYALLLVLIGFLSLVINPRMEKTLRSWVNEPSRVFPYLPSVEIVEHTTSFGYRFYAPKSGDRCWAAPHPCLPSANVDFSINTKGFFPKVELATPHY